MSTALADVEIRRLWETDQSRALEQLMIEYGDKVLHLAYFYLKDRHLAEDIAQETFIRVFRNWDKFRGDCAVSTWIYRIAANLCRDRLRSRAWRSLVFNWDTPEPRETDADLGEKVADRSVHEKVTDAVMALPQHYREVIALFYYQELSVGEIAEMLQESPGTIKSRLHRARLLLKDRIPVELGEGGRGDE